MIIINCCPQNFAPQVWYPVTPAMGKASFDGPDCIKEVSLLFCADIQLIVLNISNISPMVYWAPEDE